MKTLFFLFVFLLSTTIGFSTPDQSARRVKPEQALNCPLTTNVAITSQTSNSISFDWDDCGVSFTEYRVYYVKDGQKSREYATQDSEFFISGLSAGTYQFHFYTIYGISSSAIIIEDVIMG